MWVILPEPGDFFGASDLQQGLRFEENEEGGGLEHQTFIVENECDGTE